MSKREVAESSFRSLTSNGGDGTSDAEQRHKEEESEEAT